MPALLGQVRGNARSYRGGFVTAIVGEGNEGRPCAKAAAVACAHQHVMVAAPHLRRRRRKHENPPRKPPNSEMDLAHFTLGPCACQEGSALTHEEFPFSVRLVPAMGLGDLGCSLVAGLHLRQAALLALGSPGLGRQTRHTAAANVHGQRGTGLHAARGRGERWPNSLSGARDGWRPARCGVSTLEPCPLWPAFCLTPLVKRVPRLPNVPQPRARRSDTPRWALIAARASRQGFRPPQEHSGHTIRGVIPTERV